MNIEDQVCSLDLARKLKELGIKQNSLFYYTIGGIVYRNEIPFFMDSNYSAFTASELCEIIPINSYLRKSRKKGYWECHHIEKGGDEVFVEKNQADACAKMIIYLIESGFIKND